MRAVASQGDTPGSSATHRKDPGRGPRTQGGTKPDPELLRPLPGSCSAGDGIQGYRPRRELLGLNPWLPSVIPTGWIHDARGGRAFNGPITHVAHTATHRIPNQSTARWSRACVRREPSRVFVHGDASNRKSIDRAAVTDVHSPDPVTRVCARRHVESQSNRPRSGHRW